MKKTRLYCIYIFTLIGYTSYGQILEINAAGDTESAYSLQQLVEDVLISTDCAIIDSFSEQVSGTPDQKQTKSYGYFKRPAGSTFPFEEGVVLTTGRAFPAGNTVNNANPFPDFANGLPGDNDLETALGQTNTNDATFIKFNFVPTSDEFSFRFLMASEEYDGGTECNFADSFAFLLREVGTTAYTNLAVLPNGTFVNVTDINDSPGCAANTAFFEGYDLGDTNYGGRTVVLTASETVIPNQTYEIKLVVADQGDSLWDSAIFLEAGSFNIGLDLGEDLTISGGNPACSDDTITLDTLIPSTIASHTWYLDGTEITGETSPTLDVTADGEYSVVIDYNTNCTATDIIVIQFTENPVANPVEDQWVCDDNNNGFWNFGFTSLNSDVLDTQAAADFNISYHTNLADADSNMNPIVGAYSNAVAYQAETIFVRIESVFNPVCYETTSFEIDVFQSPITNNIVFNQCDDADDGDDTNGFIEFDLNTLAPQVLLTQSGTQFDITYHLNQSDADDAMSPLPLSYVNTTSQTQTIIVRLENVDNPDCYSTSEITLIVDPKPEVTHTTLDQCDEDGNPDGFTEYNLDQANTDVLVSGNVADYIFTHHFTMADANSSINAINPFPFTNTVNPQVLFTRVEHAVTGCYRIAETTLDVTATDIGDAGLITCDDDYDGLAEFTLSDASPTILASLPPGLTVDYYASATDAQLEINVLPDNYTTVTPNVQTIFIRVENDNDCFGIANMDLTVKPIPDDNTISDYILCSDTDSAVFDLTTRDAEVLGAQPNPILVSYHETLVDAETNSNPITGPYLNNITPRRIFVRSQFDDNSNGIADPGECYATTMSFDLIINRNPIIIEPSSIRICSEQIDTTYDLTIRENQITGGDSSITLAYYESQADLDANNSIGNPSQYLSTILNNEIYVLATGTNGCDSQTTLILTTILYANLNMNPGPIEECEIDNDGFDSFDITRGDVLILNGLNPADFIITYYENELDAIAGNTNTINDPLTFVNTTIITQTIYVRVLPIDNDCVQIVPLTLIVNPVPEIDIESRYVICLSSSNAVINPVDQTFLPNPPIDTQLSETEYSFEWFAGEVVDASTLIVGETQSTFYPSTAGFYTVNATNIASGCTIPGTTQVFASYPPEEISVEVLSLSFSGSNVIEVNVIGVGDYELSLDNGVWQSETVFYDVVGGDRTIRVRDRYNCEELIHDFTVIDYPKFFTPNNDGYNDTWNIYGLKNQSGAKIYIFDKHGKLLKQLDPKGLGWDGTFNGEYLSTDDYWFTVEYNEPLNAIKKKFTAHFTLKR